jgi:menaquinol-cytochrome c reductase iron-sulfur subunit
MIRAGQVFFGPRFSVNGELQRFAPRDPGEPLDGIGQFLYPTRFSTAFAPPGAKH